MEVAYSKAVMDEKIRNIAETFQYMEKRFNEQKEILDRIEKKVDDAKDSLSFYRGAIWVLGGVVILIVFPLIGFMLLQVISIPSIVQTAVQQNMSNYSVKITH